MSKVAVHNRVRLSLVSYQAVEEFLHFSYTVGSGHSISIDHFEKL